MSEHQTSPEEMVGRVQQSSLGAIDAETYPDLMAEDGVLEWPYAPDGVPNRLEGSQAVRDFLATLPTSGPPVRFDEIGETVVHHTADPEVVVAEYDVHGVSTSTGDRLTQRVVLVLQVRDGRIVSMRDYVNPLVLMRAMGEAPK